MKLLARTNLFITYNKKVITTWTKTAKRWDSSRWECKEIWNGHLKSTSQYCQHENGSGEKTRQLELDSSRPRWQYKTLGHWSRQPEINSLRWQQQRDKTARDRQLEIMTTPRRWVNAIENLRQACNSRQIFPQSFNYWSCFQSKAMN